MIEKFSKKECKTKFIAQIKVSTIAINIIIFKSIHTLTHTLIHPNIYTP